LTSRTRTDDWEHALAAGNGRQGVLSYGGPGLLRFTLSHERLFLPLHEPLDPPHTAAILPELRALLDAGRYQEAADAAHRHAVREHPGYAHTRDSDRFVGAATLTVVPALASARAAEAPEGRPVGDHSARSLRSLDSGPPAAGGASARFDGYRRSVDFRTGVVTQSWRADGWPVRADAFVSRPDDVVVIRLPGPATGVLRLAPIDGEPPRPVEFETLQTLRHRPEDRAGERWLALRARFGYAAGWPGALPGYTVLCRVVPVGGLLVLARTLPGEVDLDAAAAALATVPADHAALLARHAAAHADLFDRITLRLTDTEAEAQAEARAEARAEAQAKAQAEVDTEDLLAGPVGPALVERLFDAGRHAIISATGELPPNLQGVWSGTWHPPWSGDYTLDGNLQAAVAALLPAGTPELMEPLFDLLDRFRADFAANARRLYGARGILLPAHCATHGRHNHFNPTWCLTFWTAGAAWLARLYVDHWRYTGDRSFLAGRAWPFLTAAADFYCDFARVRGGVASFAPSYSPENTPAGGAGSQACVDATMDVAAVGDLLRNLLAAARELGRADEREPRWRALLAALPPYRISPAGELAEWLPTTLADNHAHRHASHLFPLWYEPDPAMEDPAPRAAAAVAVRRRLAWWRVAGPPGEMAYGLAQLGLAAAHLGLAEEAYEAVCGMARYWRPSLVPTHNLGALLNTDIAGGLPAVVLAMLATAAHGRVRLLPALPAAWPAGEVTGLALRGPATVERMRWDRAGMSAVLRPGAAGRVTIDLPPGMAVAGGDVAAVMADAAAGEAIAVSAVRR
jgi:hypothetical protein